MGGEFGTYTENQLKGLKVLVACEFSGVVRRAFASLGHDAWSCDLLEAEDNTIPHRHIQADVRLLLDQGWDLMIAHPPCTDLAVSGARHFKAKQADGRQQASVEFFMRLAEAPIPRICIENPIGIMSRLYRKPDQIVQPWQFGHPEQKATCLWLKGLPLLQATDVLPWPECHYWSNQTPSGQNKLGPSPDRWKLRSITYEGIAKAMAEQWGSL